jgi:hypothetical protein
MSESPYRAMFESNAESENELMMQELVTYERRSDGRIYRIVTTRKFYKDDYIDSQSTSVLS